MFVFPHVAQVWLNSMSTSFQDHIQRRDVERKDHCIALSNANLNTTLTVNELLTVRKYTGKESYEKILVFGVNVEARIPDAK